MFKLLVLFGVLSAFTVATIGNPFVERQASAKTAYGFVYFTGEDTANGEQIYFAVSKTNSPVSWNTVKGGTPVLTSTLGTKGLRDPFIIRDPSGSKFYLIATDLKMYNSGLSWDQASRVGSRSLAIWESPDLKTWSAQRLVQVSPPEAGMSWAPEATYDSSTGKFIVYWASKLYATSDTSHAGSSYARILYATTTDFRTFSAPAVWIDPGRDIIDTTVTWDAASGYFHRFSKTNGLILQERSKTFFGTWSTVTNGIAHAQYGDVEGPLIFESIVYPGVWHLFVDDISPRGYVPFETGNITSGVWTHSTGYALPASPRHGTVFAITAAEAANLASIV
ncbi:glycosyl hydrolase [Lyophyllum atratum]|nr:glycosyl hydrolase [Lyophyllum atratum]